MKNKKLMISILSGILVGVVLISGCIQFDKNLSEPDIKEIPNDSNDSIDSSTDDSGWIDINDTSIYIPAYQKMTNKTQIGKIGPNNRTYYTYTNEEYNFSIDYPDDWSMLPDNSNSSITFVSPKNFEGGYISMEMQLLFSVDSGGTYNSVDDVISDLIHEYENDKDISNLTINYEREEILSGFKGKELNISYNQYGFNYTQPHIIARGGKYFYMIVYVAQSEHYNEDADVYEYCKSNFKIENK